MDLGKGRLFMSNAERELTDFIFELVTFMKNNLRLSKISQCSVK